MAKRRKTLSILIIPDGEQQTFTLKFGYGLLKVLFTFLVIFFCILVFGTISYWKLAGIAIDYRRIDLENEKLLADNAKINQLVVDFRRTEDIANRIRNILGDKVDISDGTGRSSEKMSDNSSIYSNPIYNSNLRRSPSSYKRADILNSYPTFKPVEGTISRSFIENIESSGAGHFGVDIVAQEFSVIRAAGDGIIVFAGQTVSGGNQLLIDHQNGYISIYKHNSSLLVQERQFIHQGDPVALLGNSGDSTAPHLHFEVWKDYRPIDPFSILPRKDMETRDVRN